MILGDTETFENLNHKKIVFFSSGKIIYIIESVFIYIFIGLTIKIISFLQLQKPIKLAIMKDSFLKESISCPHTQK